ncbi:MAG: type II toxin-antitoxin system VapC family toxin [Planctomycetia bacterium]|nr:type II toxin-antitoxin system VapC family toxin [Planctomycetia bacterium]
MKYVVDASVALKWVLVEHHSSQALRLRADFQQQSHELHAPDVFPAECGHGLARAERRGIVPAGGTAALLGDIGTTFPQLHDSVALLQRAAALSSSLRLGFYDCLYLALALK